MHKFDIFVRVIGIFFRKLSIEFWKKKLILKLWWPQTEKKDKVSQKFAHKNLRKLKKTYLFAISY